MKNLFYIILSSLFVFSACSITATVNTPNVENASQEFQTPKNIILMIGDGMGLSQTSAGMIRNDMELELERVEHIGLSKTNSSKELITDSAAGATAFSIGEKTYNGAIGVDKNGMPKETILELLAKDGYSTGLIATCNITHATPASFYAHQPQRRMYYEIAADMANSPVDLFIGGGKIHFENRVDELEGQPDERNIIKELEGKGFNFINSLNELNKADDRVGYFLSDDHPVSILNGRTSILPDSILPSATFLSSKSDEGFFLVVEGSQIDWGGHANDSEYLITEMIDFDKAIGQALDFAEKDGNTLVIVTADHECGGYAINGKGESYEEVEGHFTSSGHTGSMVPVYAYGPQSELFSGIYDNNQIYHKMLKALNK